MPRDSFPDDCDDVVDPRALLDFAELAATIGNRPLAEFLITEAYALYDNPPRPKPPRQRPRPRLVLVYNADEPVQPVTDPTADVDPDADAAE